MRVRAAAFLLTVTAAFLAVAPQATSAAGDGGRDNVVAVTNQLDQSTKIQARTALAEDYGPTVGNQNVASARAQCADCRTVAVAVELVIVESSVRDYQPANAAVAVNDNCIRCQTFAYARQEIFDPGRMIDLSRDDRVADIQNQIAAVAGSNEPFDQMTADLDGLVQQLVNDINEDIARANGRPGANDRRQTDTRSA